MKKTFLTLILLCSCYFVMADGANDSKNKFNFTALEIDDEGIFHFSTVNEKSVNPIVIEQLLYDRWEIVGEINPKNASDTIDYSFKIETFHSGFNQFRVRQDGKNYQITYSKPLKYKSKIGKVYHFKKGNKIILSKRVQLKLYNEQGLLIKEDLSSVIDLKPLLYGKYVLCFDNIRVEFKKSIVQTRIGF